MTLLEEQKKKTPLSLATLFSSLFLLLLLLLPLLRQLPHPVVVAPAHVVVPGHLPVGALERGQVVREQAVVPLRDRPRGLADDAPPPARRGARGARLAGLGQRVQPRLLVQRLRRQDVQWGRHQLHPHGRLLGRRGLGGPHRVLDPQHAVEGEAGQLDVGAALEGLWGQPALDVFDELVPDGVGEAGDRGAAVGFLGHAGKDGVRVVGGHHGLEAVVGVAVSAVERPADLAVEGLEVDAGGLGDVAHDRVDELGLLLLFFFLKEKN